MKRSLLYVISCLLLGACVAKADRINLKQDFDSLGGNEAIVERTRVQDPKNKVKVVQNRTVDMNNRLELGGTYSLVGGGVAYYSTQTLGANLDYHINPHWSIGGRYSKSFNSLNAEGQAAFNGYQGGANASVPTFDYPVQTYLGTVSWYPLYGKLNMFDMGVTHFDIYFIGGAGSTQLSASNAPTYTGGAGIGFWWTNNFVSRLEGRYETYNMQVLNSAQQINSGVMTASIGILL